MGQGSTDLGNEIGERFGMDKLSVQVKAGRACEKIALLHHEDEVLFLSGGHGMCRWHADGGRHRHAGRPKYESVRDVALKPGGLFFVVGAGDSMKGVTVAYTNLSDEIKEKYHYDPYEAGLALARQNQRIILSKNLAFLLDNLEAAKQRATAEKKLLGFIMEWDTMLVPAHPMGRGSNSGLAHFYEVFRDNLVLVFVRHENELDKVPAAVKKGFFGPEEGGFAPNMAVVTADCSQFVCEIPYGGNESNGQIREQIFRKKIAEIKKFLKARAGAQ
jgi:hypothetical protein